MNGDSAGRMDGDLDDLIARHLDGALGPDDQRRLARQLADSPAARRTLARYLRLEAALIRLAAARQLAAPVDAGGITGFAPSVASRMEESGRIPAGPTRPRWVGLATLAVAGGLLAALLLGPAFVPWWSSGDQRGDEFERLAEQWLRHRRALHADDTAAGAFAPADEPFAVPALAEGLSSDEAEPDAAPPSWLVAAMADAAAGSTTPDEG